MYFGIGLPKATNFKGGSNMIFGVGHTSLKENESLTNNIGLLKRLFEIF